MKWKFQSGMEVTADKISEYHLLKGFRPKDVLECYCIEKDDDRSSAKWGIWIASNTQNAIRLQDLGGIVTGHGDYFRPLTEQELKDLGRSEDPAPLEDEFSLE